MASSKSQSAGLRPSAIVVCGFRPIGAMLPEVLAIVCRTLPASVRESQALAIVAGRCNLAGLSFPDRQGASKQAHGDLTGRHRPPTGGTHAVQAVGGGGNPVTLGRSAQPGIQRL